MTFEMAVTSINTVRDTDPPHKSWQNAKLASRRDNIGAMELPVMMMDLCTNLGEIKLDRKYKVVITEIEDK